MERIRKVFCRSHLWTAALWLPLSWIPVTAASLTNNSVPLHWSSAAELSRFPKAVRGSLLISREGVDFRPEKGQPVHWTVEDIRTVKLQSPRKLSLVSYENRRGLFPGDRSFDFKLKSAMPPQVAAQMVRLVGKPAVNGIPVPHVSSLATIGARRRTRTGGSSGILRFRDQGIDYLAAKGDDSRSWRWSDIETVAKPEPYRFRVRGYLETFDFELKQPFPEDLYDRVWDHLYAQALNTGEQTGDAHAKSH